MPSTGTAEKYPKSRQWAYLKIPVVGTRNPCGSVPTLLL